MTAPSDDPARCPRCLIGHDGEETCIQAVFRCYLRIEPGGDIATDRIELPIQGWPPDEPSPLDLLKEVVVLRAQVVTLEGRRAPGSAVLPKAAVLAQKPPWPNVTAYANNWAPPLNPWEPNHECDP